MNTMRFDRAHGHLRRSVCAGSATLVTVILCWTILVSTGSVRWMGSEAVTISGSTTEFSLAQGARPS